MPFGQQQLSSLVFFTVTGLSEEGRTQLGVGSEAKAALIALDKETGKRVWAHGLDSRAESSPVAVYDENGAGWIIQAGQNGQIDLLEGLTGRLVNSLTVEGEIEASPAVYNDILVLGTTGKGTSFIYGIRIAEAGAEAASPADDAEAVPEEERATEAEEAAEDEEPRDAEAEEAWDEGGEEAWDEAAPEEDVDAEAEGVGEG